MKASNFLKLFCCITIFFSILYSQEAYLKQDKIDTAKTTIKKIKKVKFTIRNSPKVTFELNLMYDYGVFELSGNRNGDFDSDEVYRGSSFGVRHGFGGMLTSKIKLNKKGSLRANVSVSYNNFNSKFNKSLNKVSEYDYFLYNVFSSIIGIENNFTPQYNIKSFIGIGVMASFISGNGRITYNKISNDVVVLPAFRLGVSLNSGLEYMLSNKLGLNCGIRFTHANIWLKKTIPTNSENIVNLNDSKQDVTLPYAGFKQFAWGTFYTGINYYVGIKNKVYIIRKYNK